MARPPTTVSRARAVAASVLLLAALTGCAPEAGTTPTPSSGADATPDASAEPTPTASPSPSATASAEIPTDCEEMLSDAVLAELEGIPLNDAAFGPSGYVEGEGLTCIWADPAADTTGLHTAITYMSRGPALDLLNDLADEEGFTCYTPDGGTRCEKTWENDTYPVTDGRTLFWRDDILIDTLYSNLAPAGYTSSIVEHIWG